MAPPRIVHDILAFLRGFLARDRYLTEALAGLTTFAAGVLALMSIHSVGSREAFAGFRDMPAPELMTLGACAPGLWFSAIRWWQGYHTEGRASMCALSMLVLLCAVSLALGLENWAFWTAFMLLLGILKGYALVHEWQTLRWAMSCLGAFFWTTFTFSMAQNIPFGGILLLAPVGGMAAANLLTVSRLSGVRDARMD